MVHVLGAYPDCNFTNGIMSGWANSEKMTWLPVNDTLRSELGISNLTGRQGKVFYRLIRVVARESQLCVWGVGRGR